VRTSLLASTNTLHYGASACLTMTLTPGTTLVSLTAYRNLDYEFFADSDSTELDLYGRTNSSANISSPRRSRCRTSSPD
jgi:hypothetical protein